MTDLQEIDGVGNSIEEKLEENGITTINELANTELEVLNDIGVRSAEKILERARDQGVMVQSGLEVEAEQKSAAYVTTGMQEVDAMLGGGLRGGFLIGVSGESKAGKTQFGLQCLSAAADFHGDAVYIETEPNRFQIDRVKSMTKKKESYKNIHKIEAYDPDSEASNIQIQKNSYDAVRDNFDDVSLVVVDSFIANFRLSGEFTSRADLPKRNAMISEHLQALQGLSNHFDCPVILTLQIQGNPDMGGPNVTVWGPTLMDHTITYVIHMTHAKGQLKEANLKGHPSLPDDSVIIKIPENAPLEVKE